MVYSVFLIVIFSQHIFKNCRKYFNYLWLMHYSIIHGIVYLQSDFRRKTFYGGIMNSMMIFIVMITQTFYKGIFLRLKQKSF